MAKTVAAFPTQQSAYDMLVPTPQRVKLADDLFVWPAMLPLVLDEHPATRQVLAAQRLAAEAALVGCRMVIRIATANEVVAGAVIRVAVDEGMEDRHGQAYRMSIHAGGIEIWAKSAAGTFLALQTLTQLLRAKEPLPGAEIEDWPDFERRGFYYDCARGKVPTRETLLGLVEEIAMLKYNEFQLYVENAFEFPGHAEMYDDTTPLTAEDLLAIDAACRERFIDFVPSLTSLGHFDKILSRPRYRKLAEAEPAELKAAGITTWCDEPWTVCPTDPASKELVREMYWGFVPQFTSNMFNICCDESWDLGKGRSKAAIAKGYSPKNAEEEKTAIGRLYVDWVRFCEAEARKLGRRIQMWGDIIVKHPGLIAELPKDATLLEWGYEADHPFAEHAKLFAERMNASADGKNSAKRSFYVAPGTSSWLSFASRTTNAFENIRSAAKEGMKNGAKGYLLTDWGDHGHQQFLGMSLLSLGWGAMAAWNGESLSTSSLRAIGTQLFRKSSGRFAELAFKLGQTYEHFEWRRFNGSVDFFLFREKWEVAIYANRVTEKECRKVIAVTEKLRKEFADAMSGRVDAKILRAEFLLTCDEIVHAMKRTILRKQWFAADPKVRNAEHEVLRAKKAVALPQEFAADARSLAAEAKGLRTRFVSVWGMRNRESRVKDVVKEFDRCIAEYRQMATTAR